MIQFGANFSVNGVPETGLSPTITIRDTSDGSIVVDAAAMSEVGDGAYRYDFSGDSLHNYSVLIDGGVDTLDSRYLSAWSERAKAEKEVSDILEDVTDIKGTGFVKDVDSLVNIRSETDKIQGIRSKTDNLQFSEDNDIKATLDGEKVNLIDSIQAMIEFIKDVEKGNWAIVSNQMVFYKEGGSELMRFNLLDKDNNPTETEVYRRERV